MPTAFDPAILLPGMIGLAREAGAEIMRHYDSAVATTKSDGSPVTAADEAAEAVILKGLAELAPGIPVLAEESVAAGRRPEAGTPALFLVDPLDGTKEYLKRNGEFTVNIALAIGGRPMLGVVYAPALGLLYAGGPLSPPVVIMGDTTTPIRTRQPLVSGLTVLVSRSHDNRDDVADMLKALPVKEKIARGSSLKLCVIAEGKGDFYPRLGPTSEWDIAAGHAILAGAGGEVLRMSDGQPLVYGKDDILNPPFSAIGHPASWVR